MKIGIECNKYNNSDTIDLVSEALPYPAISLDVIAGHNAVVDQTFFFATFRARMQSNLEKEIKH
jgi:hypothetical protein